MFAWVPPGHRRTSNGDSERSPSATLLFGEQTEELSVAQQEQIVSALRLRPDPDGASWQPVDGCAQIGSRAHPMTEVRFLDLNEDDIVEVVVLTKDACDSGPDDPIVRIFLRVDDDYFLKLETRANDFHILARSGQAYPDLVLSHIDETSDLWSWDGVAYQPAELRADLALNPVDR